MKLLFKQRLFSWFDSYDKVIEKLVTDAAGHAESGLYEIATYKNGEFGDPIKYYLVETKALDGYTLDSTQHEIVFEYVDQNTPIIEVTKNLTNKENAAENPGTPGNPGSNPKTGDETNLWLPIALMLAAGNVVAGILFGSRKKKKLNKKEEEGVSPTEMRVPFFNSFDTMEHFSKSLKGHFERNQYNNRGGFIYESYGKK